MRGTGNNLLSLEQSRIKKSKDVPDSFHDSVGFASEFDVIVRLHDHSCSDMFQLVYLLVSESKIAEWLGKGQ